MFTKLLGNVDKWLDKVVAFSDSKKIAPEVLLNSRLAPDQYPFVYQVTLACDQAKYTVAKLTGKEPPPHPDTEKTVPELRERLKTILAYLGTFKREDFAGAEDRPCTHSFMRGNSLRGGDYLDHYALPNFHFHLTTAYAILRHNGLDIGKNDYVVSLPFTS